MIVGRFDNDGQPYVRCNVLLPRLRCQGQIYFLLDTGADTTTLHPDDASALGCPFDALGSPAEFTGIGGTLLYYTELAALSFDDADGGTQDFEIEIAVAKPHPATNGLVSLLGRDVLNQLDMEYSFRRSRLWLS